MNIQLTVHTLTRKTLCHEFGTDTLHIDSGSSLLPLLTSKPQRRDNDLNDTITITYPAHAVFVINPEAGHTLYRAHMQMLFMWIRFHVTLGVPAYTAMTMYYKVIGLEDDELPYDRVYKMWQRGVSDKKPPQPVTFSRPFVLPKVTTRQNQLESALLTISHLIQADADAFLDASGMPDINQIRKALIHCMVRVHGMKHSEAAHHLGTSRVAVTKLLQKVRNQFDTI